MLQIALVGASAQKITLTDLTILCSKSNWDDVNQSLINKGWEFYDSKKGDSEHYDVITWTFDKSYGSEKANGWFYLYTYENIPSMVKFITRDDAAYRNINNSLKSSGYSFKRNEVLNNEVVSFYENSSYYVEISNEKRKGDNYYDEAITAYNFTAKKKGGVYDSDNGVKYEYHLISPYGIALPKSRMFGLGARNAIYYTSSYSTKKKHPTMTDVLILEGAQLPDDELYRYIMTDMQGFKDWSHEREWRWADIEKNSKHNGLPIWIMNEQGKTKHEYTFGYEEIILLVRTMEEYNILKEKMLNQLIQDPLIINHSAIKSTSVIVKDIVVNYCYANPSLWINCITFEEIYNHNLYFNIFDR